MAKPKPPKPKPCPKDAEPESGSAPNWTMKDAATYLGVTERCVRYMIADGRLPAYRLSHRLVRLRKSEIDDALARGAM